MTDPKEREIYELFHSEILQSEQQKKNKLKERVNKTL